MLNPIPNTSQKWYVLQNCYPVGRLLCSLKLISKQFTASEKKSAIARFITEKLGGVRMSLLKMKTSINTPFTKVPMANIIPSTKGCTGCVRNFNESIVAFFRCKILLTKDQFFHFPVIICFFRNVIRVFVRKCYFL